MDAAAGDLAAKLWGPALLRALAMLVLGVFVVSRPLDSPDAFARGVGVYWAVEGLVALWTSHFAASLGTSCMLLVMRGGAGMAGAGVLLAVPLVDVLGSSPPPQVLSMILALAPGLTAIGLQIVMVATFDLPIAFEVRRRIPGEWSVVLGAALSIVFGGLVATSLVGVPTRLGRGGGAVALAGAVGVAVAGLRLRQIRR